MADTCIYQNLLNIIYVQNVKNYFFGIYFLIFFKNVNKIFIELHVNTQTS